MKPKSGREIAKTLNKLGYQWKHKSGSHIILTNGKNTVSIPDEKEVSFGVQSQLKKLTGIKL